LVSSRSALVGHPQTILTNLNISSLSTVPDPSASSSLKN